MDLELTRRVALVTGADSGIGREVARLLLEEGARVAITDRGTPDLEAARAALAPLGELVAIPADVTSTAEVKAMIAAVGEQLGKPDILVHCAGVQGATGEFIAIDDEGWRRTLDVNLMGAVRVCREVIPLMREKRAGRIVLIASEDAVQPYVDELPYCASKAAILNLAKGLSRAYGCDGVMVNTVSPAFIATPMTDAMMKKRADEQGTDVEGAIEGFLREERPTMVLKRRGLPEEVAAAVLFLVSGRASFVTGADLRVDSGSVNTVAG